MKNKIRVFEAFAGYGSQSMALRRLGIDYEVIGISEIDKYAIQAYMAVHGETPNYGDISKIDWKEVPDFDFLTYSFPCTDISSAGLQKGLEEGSGTRSSLLWECKKAIEAKKPKYLLMENVKALTYKKFRPYLEKWLDYLKDLGYTNFAKVLNAKNYGVPQNRERIFVVSVLGCADYSFPEGFELDKRLKDVLEKDVDESFYLSKKAIDGFNRHRERMKERGNGFGWEPTDGNCIASSVLTTAGSRPHDNYIKEKYGNKRVQSIVESGKISGDKVEFIDAYNQQVQDICGTIKTTIDSSCMSFITEPNQLSDDNTKRLNDICIESEKEIIGISVHPNGRKLEFKGAESITAISPALRATDYKCPHVVWEQKAQIEYKGKKLNEGDGLYLSTSQDFFRGGLDGISRTLKATNSDAGVVQNYRIRKLTPRECFRLMGVSESDIDKIQSAGISKTQQYKMAGNSIVVDVLYYIFKKMFVDKSCEDAQLSLF